MIRQDLSEKISMTLKQTPQVFLAPEYNPKGYPDLQALFIQGVPYQGLPTRAFAYIGFPKKQTDGRKARVPAVVLVHGGGGIAFPQWVKKWNDRGYAAIAFCHTGFRPVSGECTEFETSDTWTREKFPASEWIPGPDNDSMLNCEADLCEQWMYHAVNLTILAHNLLRQDERVDASRIGLCGISWGAVVSSIVVGYDTRFAFAVPVYGSGYLDECLGWMRPLFSKPEVKALWAAENLLKQVDIPVLWLCWANDPCFSVQANSKSCASTPLGELSIQQDIWHSHPNGWNPPEIYRFADSVVQSGQPLARCVNQPPSDGESTGCLKITKPSDAERISAKLIYITEPMTYSPNGIIKWDGSDTIDQSWHTKECAVKDDTVWIDFPMDVVSYYIELTAHIGDQVFISSSQYINCIKRGE